MHNYKSRTCFHFHPSYVYLSSKLLKFLLCHHTISFLFSFFISNVSHVNFLYSHQFGYSVYMTRSVLFESHYLSFPSFTFYNCTILLYLRVISYLIHLFIFSHIHMLPPTPILNKFNFEHIFFIIAYDALAVGCRIFYTDRFVLHVNLMLT